MLGIPLYSDIDAEHDFVVQAALHSRQSVTIVTGCDTRTD